MYSLSSGSNIFEVIENNKLPEVIQAMLGITDNKDIEQLKVKAVLENNYGIQSCRFVKLHTCANVFIFWTLNCFVNLLEEALNLLELIKKNNKVNYKSLGKADECGTSSLKEDTAYNAELGGSNMESKHLLDEKEFLGNAHQVAQKDKAVLHGFDDFQVVCIYKKKF